MSKSPAGKVESPIELEQDSREPELPAAKSDPLEKLNRTVAFVAAVIGVTVSATAFLSSCDASTAQRFKSFREAVASEETYWKGLYTDYQGVFTKDFDDRPPARRARILAIYTLAQREPATFAEFSVPDSEREQASQLIETMKTGLLNALQDTDPALSDELRRRAFLTRASERPARTADSSPEANPIEPVVTPPPAAPTAQVAVLSPARDSGWDVDLYWCPGANQNANYQTASTIAGGFASLAVSGRTIAPGVALGRVRIRPASAALQRPPGGPANGFTVVYDNGPGESEAGRAVLDTINESLGSTAPRFRLLRSVGTPTRWLISAFVCAPSSVAAAPPSPRETYAR